MRQNTNVRINILVKVAGYLHFLKNGRFVKKFFLAWHNSLKVVIMIQNTKRIRFMK